MATDEWGIARDARVLWQGGLADGVGHVEDGPGAAAGATLTWPGRIAPTSPAAGEVTSPEQLIAAAHAGCYSMSLAAVLGSGGTRAVQLEVHARCRARMGKDGLRIEAIELVVDADVPGLDEAGLSRAAEQAERQCPVSATLRGNVEIRVTARLVGAAG
jgi:osmotically inducible protein OsmC